MPGPGSYEQQKLQLTKPIPLKRQSPQPKTSPTSEKMSRTFHEKPMAMSGDDTLTAEVRSANMSRKQQMNQSLYSNQQSWAFKSKEPKVAIYRD